MTDTPYREIDVREAHRDLDRYHVVDVRQPEEYVGELGHIAGSRLVPLGELVERLEGGRPADEVVSGDVSRPWLLVCRSGNRSGQACARLLEAGVTEVVNLVGGMLEWGRAGLPVRRGPASEAEDRTG